MSVTAADILRVTSNVTREWEKQRKAEERGRRSEAGREFAFEGRTRFSDVAHAILPEGYAHASGNGRYTVDKRQLYYAVRDRFRDATGREISADYFSQTLLVKYMNQYPEKTMDWKITASPRGTLTIPNAGYDLRIPCGTVAIEEHLAERGESVEPFYDLTDIHVDVQWPSLAERQRYCAVLYIEKEGFDPQLREADIAGRFDIAIISCKGQSVTAARMYVDQVCRVNGGVPLFVAHDFDPAGFSICQRLTSVSDWARRNDLVKYEFENEIGVIDFGLRLADVQRYQLKSEHYKYKGMPADSMATTEEKEFLVSGRRVELNAFTAPQFIDWMETKLKTHLGCKPFIPADEVLADAYRRALAAAELNKAINAARGDAIKKAKAAKVPASLRVHLERVMKKSSQAWDKALYQVAQKSSLSGRVPD